MKTPMSDTFEARVEELRNRGSCTDAQGVVHHKPTPPPLQIIEKGAWTFPPLRKTPPVLPKTK
jgi:hypothetical protein